MPSQLNWLEQHPCNVQVVGSYPMEGSNIFKKSVDMEKQVIYKGPGIIGLLGIAFVVLKLVGVIDWSWWLVTLPLYGPVILLIIILIIVGLIVYLNTKQMK